MIDLPYKAGAKPCRLTYKLWDRPRVLRDFAHPKLAYDHIDEVASNKFKFEETPKLKFLGTDEFFIGAQLSA